MTKTILLGGTPWSMEVFCEKVMFNIRAAVLNSNMWYLCLKECEVLPTHSHDKEGKEVRGTIRMPPDWTVRKPFPKVASSDPEKNSSPGLSPQHPPPPPTPGPAHEFVAVRSLLYFHCLALSVHSALHPLSPWNS